MNRSLKIKGLLLFTALFLALSCSSDEDEQTYVPIPEAQSPVVVDLTQVPYAKLSDYKFFDGALKDQKPSLGVLPYQPASQLFTDYAEKKRFVWMPENVKATFDGDGKVMQLPVGAALIKTFYYNRVQPENVTKILETRVMIRKADGWIFAEYRWNEEQTDADLIPEGGADFEITWLDESDLSHTAVYRIPSPEECFTCHHIGTENLPIGIKPQNLNFNYAFESGSQNQLQKWIDMGYLEDNMPQNIVSTVDYHDVSKPLDLRVRSLFDSNCAHCHQDGGHAQFYPLRFQFSMTDNLTNMGVCVAPNHAIPGFSGRLVTPGDITRSMVYYRMTTDEPSYRMPMLGRSVPHQEAISLVAEWINSVQGCP